MTQTLSVNANNDLYLGSGGNISISFDLEAVLEICSQVVKVRLGEVVLNTDAGIPFFQTVFNGVPKVIQFEAAIRQAILSVDGVLDVISLTANIVETDPQRPNDTSINAVLTYTAVINTTFGRGTINGGL